MAIVQQVTQSVVLFLEFFQGSIVSFIFMFLCNFSNLFFKFPHISSEENQKMQCILEKNALVGCLEAKIHPGLEKSIQCMLKFFFLIVNF